MRPTVDERNSLMLRRMLPGAFAGHTEQIGPVQRFAGPLEQFQPPQTTKTYATVVVAAFNSLNHAQTDADFICTGTNDDLTIQAAINAVNGSSYGEGRVLLLDGQFNLTGPLVGHGAVLCGMGGTLFQTFLNITIPGSGTFISGLAELCDLGMVVDAGAFNNVTVVGGLIAAHSVFVDSSGGSGTGLVMLETKAAVQAYASDCWLHVAGTGWTGINLLNQSSAHHCFLAISDGIGVATAAGATFCQVLSNTVALCLGGGIVDGADDSLITANVVRGCGDTTHDAVTLAGNRAAFMDNMLRLQGGTTRFGVRVTGTNNVVTLNDLRGSGVTLSYSDAGVGTITNMDGSANNWNLP